MKKKTIYISIAVIVILFVSVIIYIFCNRSELKKYSLYDAVPKDAILITNIKEPATFLSQIENEIFKSLFYLSGDNYKHSLIYFIDSINNSGILQNKILNSRMLYFFCKEGIKLQQISIVDIPDALNNKKFYASVLEDLKKIGTLKKRTYNDVEITELTTKINNQRIFLFVKSNLLVFSFSPKAIENSIDALISPDKAIVSEQEFKAICATAGKNEMANIYINIRKMPDFLGGFVNPEESVAAKNMKYFSGWIELDLNITGDRVNFNGFMNKDNSTADFVKIIDSQAPAEITSLEILPNTTSCYLSLAFNNQQEYDFGLAEYLKTIDKNTQREEKLEAIEKQYGINLKSVFYPMVENEVSFAVTETKEDDIFANSFTVFKVNSESAAKAEFKNLTKILSEKLNKSSELFIETLEIDQNTQIQCFVLPFEDTPEILFGPVFKECTGKYVCCIKNFVIFSNSKTSLLKFVYDALLNNTLNTSMEHNSFLEHFSTHSNMFLYFSFFKGFEIFNSMLNDEMRSSLLQDKELVYKLGNFGYQINKNKDLLYNNIVIKYSENIELKSQTIWESRLDTIIVIKPAIVANHNTNTKEILVQDTRNNLYLLSSSGRIVWKIKLDEQIMGKIYQVDFYKNNKYQYLFSTESKIHVIDILGNYVKNYPVALRSKATAPMSLFYYEDNKSYRIIIPCENKKVYLYNLDGSLVKGWEFQDTENIVNNEINHYRINNEDYIVFNDDYKSYFLLRNGDSKLNFVSKFKFSRKNIIWLDTSAKTPCFVTTDEKGTIRFFGVNGDQDSLFIKGFSPGHNFALNDINSDGTNDYVFSDGNKLEVYNRLGKLILSYEFESDISYEPVFYNFPGNKIMIGVVCADIGKIYLVDCNGNIFDGFPLQGMSQFSISSFNGSSKKFNLVVGGNNNLLYNYEIKY